jgi:putative ABC transport system permease protein
VRFPKEGDRGFASLPAESGLVLSAKLAEVLDLKTGDMVDVEVLEGKRPRFRLQLTGLSHDLSGLAANVEIETLNRLMEEGRSVSGVRMRVDPIALQALYRTLRGIPAVAGVEIKAAAIRKFREMMDQALGIMRAFNVFFATVIAFGVVYNSARVTLAERSHELATLRVLGFTRRETGTMLVGELFLLTLAALPLGWMLGRGFVSLAARSMDTEFYRIPAIVSMRTYVLATGVTLTAAVFSGVAVFWRVAKLDMIGALKCRD